MSATNNHWQISNDDLLDDPNFAESAEGFHSYDGYEFEYQAQQVADRIFAIHMAREVRGEFIFGFESNAEGEIQSASVAIACEGEWSLYLLRWLELRQLTTSREATAHDQAFAIRDALMAAYAEVREFAIKKELI
jgi:hypothetical protein